MIDAPSFKVLSVIADLASYPDWSQGISSVEILEAGEDSRPLRARFRIESGPIRDTYELAYSWRGDYGVSWQLTQGEVVTAMDGSYALTPTGDSTAVQYRLAVDVKIPMLGVIKRKAEQIIIDTALQGLKERVESGAAS